MGSDKVSMLTHTYTNPCLRLWPSDITRLTGPLCVYPGVWSGDLRVKRVSNVTYDAEYPHRDQASVNNIKNSLKLSGDSSTKEPSLCFRRYYKTQDELITAFEELHLEVDDVMETAGNHVQMVKKSAILAKVSFFCNLVSKCIRFHWTCWFVLNIALSQITPSLHFIDLLICPEYCSVSNKSLLKSPSFVIW